LLFVDLVVLSPEISLVPWRQATTVVAHIRHSYRGKSGRGGVFPAVLYPHEAAPFIAVCRGFPAVRDEPGDPGAELCSA
jgi:hypothetical protein